MLIRPVVVALCAALALSACSSDPEPRPLPPLPPSSPIAAAALPVPPEATPETPQGAAAFSRYWVEVLEQALATGDATRLKELSDDGCGGCNNLIGAAEGGATGETVRGAEFVVEFAEAPPLEAGETIVTMRYSRGAGELLAADGTVATPIAPEGPVDAEMRVARSGSGWVVLGFRGRPA